MARSLCRKVSPRSLVPDDESSGNKEGLSCLYLPPVTVTLFLPLTWPPSREWVRRGKGDRGWLLVSEVTSLGAREINGGFVGLVYDIYGSSEALNAVRKFTCEREVGRWKHLCAWKMEGGIEWSLEGIGDLERQDITWHVVRVTTLHRSRYLEDLLCALPSRSHWIIRYWGLKANMVDDIVFVVPHTVFVSPLVWLHQNIQYLLSAKKPEDGGKCFKFFSFLAKFFPPVKDWRQDDLI